ncbi:MAG: purine-nucleoside phosphorylase [Solirubrobacteraceae bacterium]
MADTIHLHPTAPLAERVLMPGDPGRALLLAQSLLREPKMFNHNRGLWGYSGTATDGRPLTIQSTGIGGPSAAIVITELAQLGARTLLRVGTCGALDQTLELGELLIAVEAIAADGASRSLGAGERLVPTPELVSRLGAAGSAVEAAGVGRVRSGTVVSTDLFYDGEPGSEQRWLAAGALAVEMESATLFALAARRGLEAASALIVSDIVLPSRQRIEPGRLRDAEHRLGELAARALAV